MKTNLYSISSVLAAMVILPVSAPVAGIALMVIGILAVFAADYGRTIKPISLRADVIPFNSAANIPVGMGEAA
jgi:hypothetical protein